MSDTYTARWTKPAWTFVRQMFRAWWSETSPRLTRDGFDPAALTAAYRDARHNSLRGFVCGMELGGVALFKVGDDGRTVTA